ncbi:receptor-type tyrosine-protein phosphatase F-like isoform X2 [Melanotaenia boesemani]|uniref:receptor-type tyrosine-protein phosphatase F-like isoform X2 n=1 Tax=Melanotaenia boesemani TaxID=1250792 RepID=UPI001C054BF2|nr:receptor-type tyrosine-protein phosphatase F-like isoform X2 [Melanotaenia boesemani]
MVPNIHLSGPLLPRRASLFLLLLSCMVFSSLADIRRVPPRFAIQPTDQEVIPGGSVSLTCVAVGSPMPYVKWMMGGKDLTKEDEMPIGRNVLEVTNIHESANYTCIGMSSLGIIEATAQVTVKALPKPPTSVTVTETTATSVTLTWDSGNPDQVSYYMIQYRAKSSDNGYQEVERVATTRYSIGGLSPYSEYEFRVMAVNNIGRGPPSDPVETRTGEQAPSSPPLHIQARMLSASTMLVQWAPPDEPNGQIRGYRVYYSTDMTAPLSAWQKHNTDVCSLTIISGLIPDTTYSLRVLGFTSVGDGPPSDILQVKTQQGVPAQPSSFEAEAVLDTRIVLTWLWPVQDPITKYELQYWEAGSDNKIHVTFNPAGSYAVDGLKPDTLYHFSLAARSEMGLGVYTQPIEARTAQSSLLTFIKSPEDQMGISGGVASFVCQATGEPKPRITWMTNGKTLSSHRFEVIEFDDGSGSVLRIQPLRTHRDEAIYECTATNSIGEINTSAKLTVLEENQIPQGFPTINMGPQLKVVERTRTATMLCAASGNPDPEISWFKDMLPVDISSSNGRIKQLRSGALQIENTEESDQGKYECVAMNSAGTLYSAPANLYVRVRRVPPRFAIQPTDQEVMPGGSVSLTCVAVGSPMPYVKWMMGGKDLTQEDEMPIGRNVLEVTNIHESANYTCIGMSSLGIIEATAQVTVKALPKPPTSVTVTETTATSVTLTWDSGNPDQVSYYMIQYRAKSSDNGYQEVERVATTRYSIGGLSPYSEYEFRVMAVNNIGRGPPSDPVETHTGEQAPSSPPLHIQALMLSASTMLVQWAPPDEPNGQIRGYRVYYSTDMTAPLSAWQKHNTDVCSLTIISGLIPDTTYSLRVLGFTSVGDGPPSDILQVKTQQGVPAQPSSFEAEAVLDTRIVLTWLWPVQDPITKYELQYWEAGSDNKIHVTFNPAGSYAVDGLKPDTLYHFSLAARSEMGLGVYTQPIEARTAQSSLLTFIKSPEDQMGISGGVASFVCQATGEPKPRITWMTNGKTLSSHRFEVIEFDDGSGSVLRIQPLRTHRDEAIYECTATNSIGEINTSAKLTVLEENQIPQGFPTIDMAPQLKVVERTRTATMLCAASGNPDPEISWFKDMLPVDISSSNGRIKQLRSGALQIENTEESDQGKYECVAMNSAGTRYSAPANLYVRVRRVPPRFAIPPTNQEVMPGGSVSLTCVAVGSPMPYVKWMMGGKDLTKEDEMPMGRNVLEVTNIRESANYTCIGMSSLGIIEATAQVTVKGTD